MCNIHTQGSILNRTERAIAYLNSVTQDKHDAEAVALHAALFDLLGRAQAGDKSAVDQLEHHLNRHAVGILKDM